MNKYQELLDNSDLFFQTLSKGSKSFEVLENKRSIDSGYIDFINKVCDGGYFYNRSLQIYSVSGIDAYNIFEVNELLKKEYQSIIQADEFFFAQELFGNQFGFSANGVVFFNIETGEKEIISSDFEDWVNVLLDDLDYYSGRIIMEQWKSKHGVLNYGMRLCAVKPFIIGGEYEVENLYASSFPNYITSNSNIAKQIYNLPDGTAVKLKLYP